MPSRLERATRDRPVGKVIARAVAGPVNLAVGAAGAIGGMLLHAWPVIAVGGIAYVAMVAWDLVTPEFWSRVESSDLLPPSRLPQPDAMKDPPVRSTVRELWIARNELARVIGEASPQVRGYVGIIISSLGQLESHAAELVSRADLLGRYLGTVSPALVEQEVARLRAESVATDDPEARRQFEQALTSRQEQLRALDDIKDAHDRVNGTLSKVVAALQALPAKVVRMQVMDAESLNAVSGDVNRELDTLNNEVSAFEDTLRMPALEAVRTPS
jgi:hypothetical protein